METPIGLQKLEQVLADLKAKNSLSFEEVCDLLFTFHIKDFEEIYQISALEIPAETCMRIPVFQGEFFAALKIWGINYCSVIRDHVNYDTKLKVLKGSLTEISYRENDNFIEYDSRATAKEGDILIEKTTDINSIINNSDEITVSLHVYRTPKLNVENVRIFDTEQRRIGQLSHHATVCSWKAVDNHFKKITQI
ncbi:hypothetical protein OA84_09650 [Kaistella solincola]|uniref:Cysteine dioxygenase type I n=2 Tax=Kaistella TaxID=2782231 RepID=A0A1I3JGG8_9FLAO|nr:MULTISPECIES: hypothetical protein [Kaistella]KIA83728.1 hypothetical protein OA84_09650 [Kaistella solincola]SFI59329.1 Cysteine dioxygenase type I [Kaistella treverensis]